MSNRSDRAGARPTGREAAGSFAMPARTRGVVLVHSAPAAVAPHVEWAVSAVLGVRADLEWTPQPAAPGLLRAELSWVGEPGTGSRLASGLRTCRVVRFEVTEEAHAVADGERYAYTPALGLFSAVMSRHGDVLVPEHRLRAAMAGEQPLQEALDALLGAPWDDELEAFRCAGEGAPVRWLHQAG